MTFRLQTDKNASQFYIIPTKTHASGFRAGE